MNGTSSSCSPTQKCLLSVREAALLFGFGQPRNLYRAIREGFIPLGPVVRLGRRKILVNRPLFERWLASGGGQLAGQSPAAQHGLREISAAGADDPLAAEVRETETSGRPGESPHPTMGGDR